MYKVVIGLEVHCELNTKSKNFSSAKNAYSLEPNTNISVVDLGFPGILPVTNEEAVRKALKVAMALNCQNPDEIIFDRKNYFYPDLPKGYQITQSNKPVGINGHLMINVDSEDKRVDIHDLHLEEDTASLDHFSNYSLIDYNRAGIPLIEVVTEPCIHSLKEAIIFLESLRSVFLYCEVSEARSDKGQMRCDVNISLMKETDSELGTKVEIKNINSFANVASTIEYEIKRQTELLEKGEKIIQETRRFDADNIITVSMRSKVDAVDYKYFIEPNIPPVKLTQEYLDEIKSTIPMLQYERINKYMSEYELSRYDATILVKEKEISDFFEQTLKEGANPKISANWMNGIILSYLNKNEKNIKDIVLTPRMLTELIKKVDDSSISIKQGKEVLVEALDKNKDPNILVSESALSQIVDDEEIRKVILEVINENPDAPKRYKEGKTNIVDFLVGQVMKKTKGKANPLKSMNIMKEEIEKYDESQRI